MSLYETEIKIKNLDAVTLGLKKIEPDALKRMKRELRKAGNEVASLANARAPLSAQGGFGTRVTEHGKNTGMKVFAKGGKDPAGKNAAIFEFAGKPGNVKVSQGRALIGWLNGGYGTPGRFLWAAWGAKKTAVLAEVERVMRQAESDLQAAMDRGGVE